MRLPITAACLLVCGLLSDVSLINAQPQAQTDYWKQRQERSQQYLQQQYGNQPGNQPPAPDAPVAAGQPPLPPAQQAAQEAVIAEQEQQVNVPPPAAGTAFALRHSFSPPLAAQIPFWNTGAGAIVYSDLIRLTPQQQGRYGYVWNNVISEMSDWSVIIEFQVNGQPNGGADGFAFWYTDKPETIGSVYGSTDYWVGLGIMFDTFNNDNVGRNPIITAVYNDGTQKYDFATDGATQSLGSCPSNFRNLPAPASARITYQNKKLTVDIATRRDPNNQPAYINCFTVETLELGVDKYFGISARTGDVSDNHDVVSVLATDLSAPSVDLAAIRAQWRMTLAQQQSESNKQHEITQQEFQATVLNLLQQIQGELNLMELSSLSISEWLHKRLDSNIDDNRSSGSANSVPQITHLDPTTVGKIEATSDQLDSIIRLLSQKQGGANDPTAQMKQLSTTNDAQFRQLQTNVGQIQNKLNELSGKINSPAPIVPSVSSSGGLGSWINTILLLVSAVMTTVSMAMNWKNNKATNRYKLV